MNRTLLLAAVAGALSSVAPRVQGAMVARMGDYTLTLTGFCPGRLTLEWSGATPNHVQGILWGTDQGHLLLRRGPCAGTTLGLGRGDWIYYVKTIETGSGSGVVHAITGNTCRGFIQFIEGGTCNTTNVAPMP